MQRTELLAVSRSGITRLKLTLTVVAQLVEDGPDLGAVRQAFLLDLPGSGNVSPTPACPWGTSPWLSTTLHLSAIDRRPDTERVGVGVRCASQALRRTPEVHGHGAPRRHK